MNLKSLDRYIFREQALPFIVSLSSIIVILLTNFIIKNFDRFLGKGLSASVMVEFIFFNLAWIVALAVPMAVLISTLMGFGKLSSENSITALRASGISYMRIMRPSIIFGIALCVLMIIFNNLMLPDMNHKARTLSRDISKKRPDLEFNIGYFTESLPEYGILIESRDPSIKEPPFVYNDIKIFSKQGPTRTVTAKTGTVNPFEADGGIIFHLKDGFIEELSKSDSKNYRIIGFKEYDIFIPIDNYSFKRRSRSSRGDREMDYFMISEKIDKFRGKIERVEGKMDKRIGQAMELMNDLGQPATSLTHSASDIIEYIDSTLTNKATAIDKSDARRLKNFRNGLKSDTNLLSSYTKTINKYRVEMHKKFSIPFACIIFILLGAPLGIIVRNSGLSISFTMSLGFFIVYWSFLIGGEELADRNLLSPWIAMWLPNIVFLLVGIYMIYFISYSNRRIKFKISSMLREGK